MRPRPLILALALALLVPAGPAPARVPVGGAVRVADAGTAPLAGRARENVAAFARLLAYVRHFHPSDQAVKADWDRMAVAALPEVERAPDAAALARVLAAWFAPIAPTVQVHRRGAVVAAPLPAPPAGTRRLVAAWTHAGLGQRASGPFAATRHVMVARDGKGRTDGALPAPGEAHAADLGAGVACRVPLALWADAGGTLPARPQPAPPALPGAPTAARRAVRLAAVATAWGALRHFHPRLDRDAWEAALPRALAEAAEAPDAAALALVLRRLTARLDDGLVVVRAPARAAARPALALAWVEERLVVTAVRGAVAPGPGGPKGGGGGATEGAATGGGGGARRGLPVRGPIRRAAAPVRDVAVGDEVLAIDGATAGARMAEALALVPGATPARRRWAAAEEVLAGAPGTPVVLRLARPGRAPWTATARRSLAGGAAPTRPPAIGPIARGAWYVDLTRADERAWRRALPRLARATGIVFDLRGRVVARTMAHALGGLAGAPLRTPGFDVPRPRRPDEARPALGYLSYAIPAAPRLAARAAFLIDASTIDLGDLAAATVAHHRLGVLVGAPTAGTAGHADTLALPGRFTLVWTGSDARGYDGAPLRPVRPDELVPATVAALREGRDEALERAIALVEAPRQASTNQN